MCTCIVDFQTDFTVYKQSSSKCAVLDDSWAVNRDQFLQLNLLHSIVDLLHVDHSLIVPTHAIYNQDTFHTIPMMVEKGNGVTTELRKFGFNNFNHGIFCR